MKSREIVKILDIIPSLTNKELYLLKDYVEREIRLSNIAINEGFEDDK